MQDHPITQMLKEAQVIIGPVRGGGRQSLAPIEQLHSPVFREASCPEREEGCLIDRESGTLL